MKLKSHILSMALLAVLFFAGVPAFAQEQKKPDVLSQAEQEADRLQKLLDLDDWQVFYVDSTLKHNYPAMVAELEELSAAKVSNSSMYLAVQDKWMEKTDSAYMKLFTEEQWTKYLKNGAGKAMKARAKRAEKAEGKK